MKENTVQVNIRGLDKFIRKIKEPWYVDIGILSGVAYPEKGVTVAYIGSVHEFGTDLAGRGGGVSIPKRSWIKMPLEEKKKEINESIAKRYKQLMEKQNLKGIFDLIGASCLLQITNAFESGGFGNWPPLSEVTIALKGSSEILIDTKLLLETTEYKVGKGK